VAASQRLYESSEHAKTVVTAANNTQQINRSDVHKVNSWHAQTYLEIGSSSFFVTISVRKTAN
jgi:hypothetical protein